MPLSTYNRRRKFKQTPEPKGSPGKPSKTLRFVIQKHDATHLHYDLRLELDGVMKSWAVPKGPSLNPADKHLAVLVEDHPISYNTFEGHIPEGNYGAGDVIIWDKGTYHAESSHNIQTTQREMRQGFKKGHLKFFLEGKKLRGLFTLVRFKNSDKEWLLIKHPDEFALTKNIQINARSVVSKRSLVGRHEKADLSPVIARSGATKQSRQISSDIVGKKSSRLPLRLLPEESGHGRRSSLPPRNDTVHQEFPKKITPMLSTLVDKPFDSSEWLFELKWDGYRALGEVRRGTVELYSRRGTSFNKKFSSVVSLLSKIKEDVLLDGEIIARNKKGVASFQALQEAEVHGSELEYVVFDILYLNGQNLMSYPLIERKKLLKIFLKKYPFLTYSEHVETTGRAFFKAVVKKNLEGIIAKKKDSPYLPGVRGTSWLKIKHHHSDEALIAGFTKVQGTRGYFGALVLGQYRDEKLEFIGHTGTGFNELMLKELFEKMKRLETPVSPFSKKVPLNAPVTWIKPVLIAEIKFSERTKDGILRQPVFLGLREDKKTEEITEEKIIKVHEIIGNKKISTVAPLSDQTNSYTHLDKVYFPKLGVTKGDVLDYYEKIAPYILPYLKDRPESLNRHPRGVGKPSFFQKNFTAPTPPFIETVKFPNESTGEDTNYLVCQNKETLLYLANLGCIEINPWNSRMQSIEYPDYLVIDLDPDDNTWVELITVAHEVKKVLDLACLPSFLKTSGKTGLHIYVPLGAQYHFDEVRKFSELLVNLVHERLPEITSVERPPAKRKKLIYLDFLQNRIGQTLAAPYSLRPTPDATVSTPLEWKELTAKLDPKKFTVQTIFKRLKRKGDIWKGMLQKKIDLKKSIACLERNFSNKKEKD